MIAQVSTVLLAFGANLGDRGKTIIAAQRDIAEAVGIERFTASPLHETVALTTEGPDPGAPKYLNGVATAQTTLTPHELLDLLQRVENEHGRVRGARWGARTLDVDLILFGGRAIKDDRLTVPHPRAHQRDFVLSPWLALDPNAVLMGHGRVAALLERIGDTTRRLSSGEPGAAESGESRESSESSESSEVELAPGEVGSGELGAGERGAAATGLDSRGAGAHNG